MSRNDEVVFSPVAGFSSGRSVSGAHGSGAPAILAGLVSAHQSLPDIFEVTFGPEPVTLVSLAPGDNRRRVLNTAVYPMRAIALLRVSIAGQVYGATGWFAGPRTVITAGHVVYTHNSASAANSGWVGAIEVIPAYNAGEKPFPVAQAVQFSASNEWVTSANTAFDYGAIFLAEPLGEMVGTLGFSSVPDEQLQISAVTLAGYPVVNPDPIEPDGSLWEGSAVVSSFDNSWLRYPITTSRGQSGSPVFRQTGGTPAVMGIHAYGSAGENIAMRINDRVFQHIQQWRLT